MRKIVTFLIVAVLAVSMMVPTAFAAGTTGASQQVSAGQTVTVAFTMNESITLSTFRGIITTDLQVLGVSSNVGVVTYNYPQFNVVQGNGDVTVGAGEALFAVTVVIPADAQPNSEFLVSVELQKAANGEAEILPLSGSFAKLYIPCVHSFTNYVYNNDATCGVDGTETATCDVCGKVTDTRPATGTALTHSFTNYVSNGDATCGVDGTKTAVCDNGCGATDTITDAGSALTHDMQLTAAAVAPDCENPGKTAVYTCAHGCGHTEGGAPIDALGHDMKETAAAIPATCEGEGKTAVKECSRCDHKEGGAKIDALGHDWELTKSEAGADCLTAGKDTYTCKNDKTHVDVRDNTKYGPHADEEFASNNNGTHDGYCPKCEQKLTDDEKCFDTNKDGKCDGCGYKFPETPTTKPDDGKDDVPKTGDITPYPVYFLVALMAVAAAAYGLKRKFDI